MTKVVPTPDEYFRAHPLKTCERCEVEKPNNFENFPKRLYKTRFWFITANVCFACRTAKSAATRSMNRKAGLPDADLAITAIADAVASRPISPDEWEQNL
jgi:hypothetical protein